MLTAEISASAESCSVISGYLGKVVRSQRKERISDRDDDEHPNDVWETFKAIYSNLTKNDATAGVKR